jgi:hypothetical protein
MPRYVHSFAQKTHLLDFCRRVPNAMTSRRLRLGLPAAAALVVLLWSASGGPGTDDPFPPTAPRYVPRPTDRLPGGDEGVFVAPATPEQLPEQLPVPSAPPAAASATAAGGSDAVGSGEEFRGWAASDSNWIASNALQASPLSFGPGSAPRLLLTPAALAAVRRVTRPTVCPDRFVFVNTHTFGRHHNQLQEMLNLASWARSLNRTAVIGWFRHNHKWTAMDALYDFSGLAKHFCVATHKEFATRWGALPAGKRSAACAGQGVSDTPIKSQVRKCRMVPGVPAHYDSRLGVDTTKTMLGIIAAAAEAREATFLGVSGEIAFFMRPGLLEQVAAAMHVTPAAHIVAEAAEYAGKTGLTLSGAGGESADVKAGGTPEAAGRPYFGLHLRQREKECMKEMGHTWADGGAALEGVPEAVQRAIEGQCAVTVGQFDGLVAGLRLAVGSETAQERLFLASDHQNMALEKSLVGRGAVMYAGGKFHTREMGGLEGLGVDFHMLQRAAHFTGNQLSSVSQNVCFHRLGKGLGCEGFVMPFTLYHSRNVDSGAFVPNVPWRP